VKVVLDTNILISAFVFPGGPPEDVFRAALEDRIETRHVPTAARRVRSRVSSKFGWEPSIRKPSRRSRESAQSSARREGSRDRRCSRRRQGPRDCSLAGGADDCVRRPPSPGSADVARDRGSEGCAVPSNALKRAQLVRGFLRAHDARHGAGDPPRPPPTGRDPRSGERRLRRRVLIGGVGGRLAMLALRLTRTLRCTAS
jgi:hypothetical protein